MPLDRVSATQALRRWTRRGDSALPLSALNSIQAATLAHTYRGVRMLKNPFDLALYTKLLWEMKPRTIVEIGSHSGGSALWFSDQLRAFGVDGHVHSLDIAAVDLPEPPGVTFHRGNAHLPAATFPVDWIAGRPRPLLVVDDADHTYEGVRATLRHFGPMMRSGEYIVAEDGIVGDLGIAADFNGGPNRAVAEFLRENSRFQIDRTYCDYFGRNITWNVDGYLRCLG